MKDYVPPTIAHILATSPAPDILFDALMPALGKFLYCDRCFLYLRNPQTHLGRVPFYWTRHAKIPVIYDKAWKLEPDSLSDEDPLFAAALRMEPSIFVEDVETASPYVVNQQFERKNFGHRSLIHAHLGHDKQLWGVLQPCVFGHPRQWTSFEKQVMHKIVKAITPQAIAYVHASHDNFLAEKYIDMDQSQEPEADTPPLPASYPISQ